MQIEFDRHAIEPEEIRLELPHGDHIELKLCYSNALSEDFKPTLSLRFVSRGGMASEYCEVEFAAFLGRLPKSGSALKFWFSVPPEFLEP